MNLDELRAVQSEERRADSLQTLRPSFYREVGEYVASLEAERDRVAADADDPFASPEVGRLTDEIETARDVVEAVYERRMGKLVKQASLAAAGMPADDEGLTTEEAELFDDLVERIRANKAHVLDVLDGEAPDDAGDRTPAVSPADGAAPPTPPDERPPEADAPDEADASGVSAADVMSGPVEDEADESTASDVERITVRITRDVGSILGVDDREYTLAADDVVTLPERNAAPLVERDAAEPLE